MQNAINSRVTALVTLSLLVLRDHITWDGRLEPQYWQVWGWHRVVPNRKPIVTQIVLRCYPFSIQSWWLGLHWAKHNFFAEIVARHMPCCTGHCPSGNHIYSKPLENPKLSDKPDKGGWSAWHRDWSERASFKFAQEKTGDIKARYVGPGQKRQQLKTSRP